MKEKKYIGNGYWIINDGKGGYFIGYKDSFGIDSKGIPKNHCHVFKKNDNSFDGIHRGFCPKCRGDNLVSFLEYVK